MSSLAVESVARRDVAEWYERRTRALLSKYGGGQGLRVHYHLGCTDEEEVARASDLATVQRLMFDSQERLLERAFLDAWRDVDLRGRVLDAGCGFGGTCLWLAERFGAQVVGVTIAQSHRAVAEALAFEAGLAGSVQIQVEDLHFFEDERPFDAVVSFEAANLFDDRPRWFSRMAQALRPGGALCIDDYFAEAGADVPGFNAAYASHIGTVEEYVREARTAGFELVGSVDVTDETAAFWTLLARFSALAPEASSGWYRPPFFHLELGRAQRERRFTHRFLQFRRSESRGRAP